jgi:hypothetical protein
MLHGTDGEPSSCADLYKIIDIVPRPRATAYADGTRVGLVAHSHNEPAMIKHALCSR